MIIGGVLEGLLAQAIDIGGRQGVARRPGRVIVQQHRAVHLVECPGHPHGLRPTVVEQERDRVIDKDVRVRARRAYTQQERQ